MKTSVAINHRGEIVIVLESPTQADKEVVIMDMDEAMKLAYALLDAARIVRYRHTYSNDAT